MVSHLLSLCEIFTTNHSRFTGTALTFGKARRSLSLATELLAFSLSLPCNPKSRSLSITFDSQPGSPSTSLEKRHPKASILSSRKSRRIYGARIHKLISTTGKIWNSREWTTSRTFEVGMLNDLAGSMPFSSQCASTTLRSRSLRAFAKTE